MPPLPCRTALNCTEYKIPVRLIRRKPSKTPQFISTCVCAFLFCFMKESEWQSLSSVVADAFFTITAVLLARSGQNKAKQHGGRAERAQVGGKRSFSASEGCLV